MKKQKGMVMSQVEEMQDDRVSEWEEGLPSLADLISLSQCLISPQLASAFSITSPSPSPARSSADVALASHTTFSSLRSTSLAYPDLLGSPDAPEGNPCRDHACRAPEDAHLNAADSTLHRVASRVSPPPQLRGGDRVSERTYNGHVKSSESYLAEYTPLDAKERSNGGAESVREWHGNPQPAHVAHLGRYGGDTSVRKDQGSSAALDRYSEGVFKASERDDGGVGEREDHVHANATPCISDSSDVAAQPDIEVEAEEAESGPYPSENPNEETIARTLKRPRLVWTPELHKRFVDAVSHLGVKTAVPKTIMQLMNVEGLTRENVASHLQKYRLYLKRMQGLSNEGPTSSDHIFASSPVPASLATAGRFHASMPALLQDISQVPFAPTYDPTSIGRGHATGIMSSPLPPMDPYSFNIFAWSPSYRFLQGDLQDVQAIKHNQSVSLQHIAKK